MVPAINGWEAMAINPQDSHKASFTVFLQHGFAMNQSVGSSRLKNSLETR
jgi:hypothetical protein